jgi:hypothetical protein
MIQAEEAVPVAGEATEEGVEADIEAAAVAVDEMAVEAVI